MIYAPLGCLNPEPREASFWASQSNWKVDLIAAVGVHWVPNNSTGQPTPKTWGSLWAINTRENVLVEACGILSPDALVGSVAVPVIITAENTWRFAMETCIFRRSPTARYQIPDPSSICEIQRRLVRDNNGDQSPGDMVAVVTHTQDKAKCPRT
ncbi:hypothetical protein BD410DRAFT_806310 [Rickenella mellea]|uniref:Uncharacterized protein n=1 Tax=Rickenella mellea TaxID=50990 RepID=A0A4Y7PTL2_9AGAM|nr:hypothetical protein BD410DRAFT_806310 [Rickenella mellea]